MARDPRSAGVDPSGLPTSGGEDATAAERATDEGMPEAPRPTTEGQALQGAATDVSSLGVAAGNIDVGPVRPIEGNDRRGTDDDESDEHDLGGEG